MTSGHNFDINLLQAFNDKICSFNSVGKLFTYPLLKDY